jgi:hypothetical protein
VGDEITPNGTHRDWLMKAGYVTLIHETEQPSRPARMSRAAAAKVTDGVKQLFGGGKS